jgi:3'-phosphoadenosine 5'-phosphosulfate sulfotransferase (PAPS reductase)/FAD synthetase
MKTRLENMDCMDLMKEYPDNYKVISWFSCGASSAVATKILLRGNNNIEIVNVNPGSEHPDNQRFLKDCEKWFNQKIITIKSEKYKNVIDVIYKTKYVNGEHGARCTVELKKKLYRKYLQNHDKNIIQSIGYDYSKREINRFIRHKEQQDGNFIAPLIDNKINKKQVLAIIEEANIELPIMYKLGYSHNNCIGCVKGGKEYWNKIRQDFINKYNQMAKAERYAGHSCINGMYLDKLPIEKIPNKFIEPSCDLFCEIEFADIISPKVEALQNL